MPKILRIINRFNIGGPTYNVAYLSKYMSPDFETMLVGGQVEDSEESAEYILRDLGLEPHILPEMRRTVNVSKDRVAYHKIKKIIKDFQPDIVHTHASKAGALGRLAAAKMNVPLIFHTFHGHVFHSYFGKVKTRTYKNVERRLARKSTKIIAISELQCKELSKVHKICDASKIEVVPLGFDLQKFRENKTEKRKKFRQQWEVRNDELAIGIIGRLVPIKNHHFFLRIIKRVSEQVEQSLKAFIIGDGELMDELKCYAQELGLNNVVFTSWIRNMDEANNGLDIVCLTSKNEGTPVSLIEAQASGVPIVSTNVGGVENVVEKGSTALLAEANDEDTFVEHMKRLVQEPKLREDFSSAGEHVFEKFHYTRLVNDMKELYSRELDLIT